MEQKRPASTPDEPEGRGPELVLEPIVLALVGCGLLLGIAYAGMVALAKGPGSYEPLVDEGPELVAWYGLPPVGLVAAVTAFVLLRRTWAAASALVVSALTLAAWYVSFGLV